MTPDPSVSLSRLREIVASLGADRTAVDSLKSGDDLVKKGVLDSLAMIGFVAKLEEAFGLKIPAGELEVANFATLKNVAALIERLR